MEYKKKILIISEVFYPEIGSGANRMANIMMLLKEQGFSVDIITSQPKYPNPDMYKGNSKYLDKEKDDKLYTNSKITRINGSKIKPTSNFFVRLYIYMFFFVKAGFKILGCKEKYHLVIATIPSSFTGVLGIIAKYKFNCRFILDIRDLWPECIKNIGLFRKNKFALKLAYLMEKIILKKSDSIVINSDGFREYLINKGYDKDIEFIPNALRASEVEDYREISKDAKKYEKFTVIYAGNIGLPQNIRSIVKVANYLKDFQEIRFKIIGEGIQKIKVKELIEHYNLNNITLHNAMPKKEVIEEIVKCHISIVHLRNDSAFDLVIPGKIIDNMGLGIPIIAGIEGYTATVLKEYEAGIVVEPDDYKSMSEAIIQMYTDYELRKEVSRNGLRSVKEKFCWENNIVKYNNLILDMIGERRI